MLTLLPDMNVAPLKYAHVQKQHGGPIEAVSYVERDLPTGKMFEGFANLDEKITGIHSSGELLYANVHGSGFAATKAEAIHCAISEAMERWGWYAASQDAGMRKALRFDLDATTAGFSAFPGLGVQGAMKRALFEAAENWAIGTWWDGKLPHKDLSVPGLSAILVQSTVPGIAVVVIWKEEKGQTYFGSAASHSQASAIELARLDMQHHQDMLAFCKNEKKRESFSLSVRRMQHFAEPAGFAAFRERLAKKGSTSPAPTLLVDESVRGPWTQYAHVWRCLFDSNSSREKDRVDYFLF